MDELCDIDLKLTGTYRGRWSRRPEMALQRDLVCESMTVPKGFVVDGFSLPGRWFAKFWQPKKVRWLTASTLHDWAYETKFFGNSEEGRAKADGLLRAAMLDLGVHPVKAWIVWAAVRMGGEKGYGAIAPQNIDLVTPFRPDLRGVVANAPAGPQL